MPNAIKMLQDDHNSIRILLGQIQQVPAGQADVEDQAALQIESMLTTHIVLMEEFILPLLAKEDPDLVAQSEADYAEVGRLLGMASELPGGMERRAVFGLVQDLVQDHVVRQDDDVIPLISDRLGVVALEDLGRDMMGRQQELMRRGVDTVGAAETGRTPGVHPHI